tara:strand:+ start:228 stop:626 length:399 start_codon:yes stop_codon:yes gene_type:complete
MNKSDIELPSNRKFGIFFSVIFLILSAYFFFENKQIISLCLLGISTILILVTLINDNLLLPLNKVWMKLGFLLGVLISPVVLGLIFFLLFTPISIITKSFGRDELRIKFKRKKTYWIERCYNSEDISFKLQF